MTPIEDVSASAEVSDLSLTLTDGTKLAVTAANIGLDFVRGTITEADTRRVAAYFQSWHSRRIASTTDDALAGDWAGYEVAIPRSDILDVQNRKVSVLRTVLFVVGVPVTLASVGLVALAFSDIEYFIEAEN
ncbi:MAG: hypothetical protein HKN13_01450 [Rhodothermales bacterium]|nr:hypothetical protein [Rhodothermales bacterium]